VIPDQRTDLHTLIASSFLSFLKDPLHGSPFSPLCHVLFHLRHLSCCSCLLCLGFALTKSEKKAGDKKPNERGTSASTSRGDSGRSTRERLDDPHGEQCSAKGCGFIFFFSPVFRVGLGAELEAGLPASNGPDRPLASISRKDARTSAHQCAARRGPICSQPCSCGPQAPEMVTSSACEYRAFMGSASPVMKWFDAASPCSTLWWKSSAVPHSDLLAYWTTMVKVMPGWIVQ
jgi:hypothetical protein